MKCSFRHIVTIVFLLAAIPLFSQPTEAKLKKNKADTEKEIERINRQINENDKAKKSQTEQIALLNSRIEQRRKLIRNTDLQISITEAEIYKKNNNINELKSKIIRLKDSYAELIVNIYTNRKKATWLMYVFASEDFSQAFRRLKYLQSYADVVSVQAKKIEQTNQQLGNEISLLLEKKHELDNYKSERSRDMEHMAKDEAEAKKMLSGLNSETAKLKKQLQRKRADLANLDKQIREIVKKEITKDKSTGFSKSPANVKLSADFAANRGRLPWPVAQGKIVGFFGDRFHPVYKHIELSPSTGIDISTIEGENVLATFDGVVVGVLQVAGMNICVMLKHGEYFTFYCRLGVASVKRGANVNTGTVLGKVAAGRDSDGSQLHFEMWKADKALDPYMWLLKK
ncbi:MAG: peptidoglycan DD-metalloendopeptidase family protein [Prevotellaceae bacterium]|jgi:septal ring factor EnvC (AmiA/AmiB activator)|nr:peptidoglycan DD-metalloendopeptidase family protein [Prevotellaceae bacterium]